MAFIEQVCSTREPLLIALRGKPIAKLVPADQPERPFIGRLKGLIRVNGDIEGPVEPLEA